MHALPVRMDACGKRAGVGECGMERIAIIGVAAQRGPVVRRAAQMGLEPHSFAWRGAGEDAAEPGVYHAVGMQDELEVLRICRELGVAGVVPVGSDVAARTAAAVTRALGLPGADPAAVATATSKAASRAL